MTGQEFPMDRSMIDNNRWLILCAALAMLSFALPTAATADSDCTDAAACGDSLDESVTGDNQAGDSGSDRDPPSGDRDKPS
jgi:hypothetical protein